MPRRNAEIMLPKTDSLGLALVGMASPGLLYKFSIQDVGFAFHG